MSNMVVGVLGGGQLGRMMCPPAARLGLTLRILDPSGATSPAGQCLPQSSSTPAGSFQDAAAVTAFAEGCDVVTVEIEHISCDGLEQVACDVQPSPATLRLIQDKFLQKEHLARVGVPLGPYMEVAPPTAAGVAAVAATFGFPLMLKSRLGAYDGKGNAVVRSEADIEAAMEALGGGSMLYAEKWVPFAKELAVMVARSTDGSVVAHPVVETVQRNNVCHIVTTEGITPTERDATSAIAMQAISSLDGAGIYGVELFLLEDGSVLLNEIAPRPHNSGHYTIEACVTCQFEQHLRAVLGLPLGDPSLKVGCAAMVNILGDLAGAEGEARAVGQLTAALSIAGASGHWYGKAGCRPGRKMGHITVVADDAAQLKVRLDAVLAACE